MLKEVKIDESSLLFVDETGLNALATAGRRAVVVVVVVVVVVRGGGGVYLQLNDALAHRRCL